MTASVITMANEAPYNPIELAYAVAALQTGANATGLLSAIPQSLADHVSKTSHRDATEQPAGTDTHEDSCSNSERSATPDLFRAGSADDDSDKRLERSRERNREHARRTRLRKKASLEALQSKVKGLEAERQVLKQNIEECGIASILLGLSAGDHDATSSVDLDSASTHDEASHMVALLSNGKRKRFLSESMAERPAHPLTLDIDGKTTIIGGAKSHINWKTGFYRDELGVQQRLTTDQLETLRRERNRMHAKMTRDRKKCFITTIQKTIDDLENENNRMRGMLAKISSAKFSSLVTPVTSPDIRPSDAPSIPGEDDAASVFSQGTNSADVEARQAKRARHGFSLDC